MNTPWSQEYASVTSGTTLLLLPPKMKMSTATPSGFSQSGQMIGHCEAGAVKRALRGPRRPCSRASSRGLSSLWHGPENHRSCPSHHTSPSSVRAQFVKMTSFLSVSMAMGSCRRMCLARPRRTRPGVDGVQPVVPADLHPGDIVADAPRISILLWTAASWRGSRLAAGRRERGRDVVALSLPGS